MSTYPNDDEYSMNGINHLSECKDIMKNLEQEIKMIYLYIEIDINILHIL